MCNVYPLVLLALVQAAGPDSVVYDLSTTSHLEVRTGKAGLLGFAGHEHLIRASGFSGLIVLYPDQPAASHVTVSVTTERLEVLTPPDTAEIREVIAAIRMEVLDEPPNPAISLSAGAIVR